MILIRAREQPARADLEMGNGVVEGRRGSTWGSSLTLLPPSRQLRIRHTVRVQRVQGCVYLYTTLALRLIRVSRREVLPWYSAHPRRGCNSRERVRSAV